MFLAHGLVRALAQCLVSYSEDLGKSFHGFFRSFSGLHKQETSEKNHEKNHGTRKFDAKHSASVSISFCMFPFSKGHSIRAYLDTIQITLFRNCQPSQAF